MKDENETLSDATALAALAFFSSRDGKHRDVLRDSRRAFIKVRRGMPADFFAAEARGLTELSNAQALRVPRVWAVNAQGIVLEDLGSGASLRSDWELAGRKLAVLHARSGSRFGFTTNGYCGDSAQDNTQDDDGHSFFAERRLLPQARRAYGRGLLPARYLATIEQLCGRLGELLPTNPPVLIHGDLWSGNLHSTASGEVALIDGGAVHYGWAVADLAMLILFGEPPPAFLGAYETASTIDPNWRSYAPLLNLYHLLNHLNLFGGNYADAVQRVLEKYA